MLVYLDHVEQLAENIRTFWFKPNGSIDYIAGQFIEITLPHENSDDRGIKRWFTLSSSPTEELVSITTKFTKDTGSSFKQGLLALKPGDEAYLSDPMGDFVLPKDPERPLVFVAGGMGITPVRSMAKWLQDTGEQRQTHYIYVAKPAELIFTDVINQSSNKVDINTGKLDAATILHRTSYLVNPLYFISGPEQLTEKLYKELKTAGVPENSLVTDYFHGYSIL